MFEISNLRKKLPENTKISSAERKTHKNVRSKLEFIDLKHEINIRIF